MLEPGRKNLPGDEVAPKKPPPAPGAAEAFVESTRTVLEQARFFKRDDSFGSLDRKLNKIAAELAASDRGLPTPGPGRGTRPVTANGPIELLAESQNQERELLRLSEKNRSSIERRSRAEQDPDSAMGYVIERWESLKSEEKALENQFGLLESIVTNFSTTGAGATQDELHAASAALIAYSWIITERQISYREIQELGLASRLRLKDDELDAVIAAASESKLSCLDMAARLVRGLTSPTGQQESDSTGSQMPAALGLDAPKALVELVHEMRANIIRGVGAPPEKLQPQQLPNQPLSDDQLRAMILRNHPSLTGPEFAPADIDAWSRVCTLSVAECFSRVSAEQDSPSKQERLMALLDTRQQVKNLELQPALPEGADWKPGMSRHELNGLKKSDLVPPNMIPILAMVLVGGLQILGIFCKNPHQFLNGAIGMSPLLPLAARVFYSASVEAFSLLRAETRGLASYASKACDPVSGIELATRAASTVQALVDSGANSASGFFARWGRVNDLRNSIMRNLAEGIRLNLVEMNRSLYSTGTIPHRKQAALDSRNAEQEKQIKEDLDQLQTELSRYSRLLAKITGWAFVVSSIPAAAAIYSMLRGVPLLNLVGGP